MKYLETAQELPMYGVTYYGIKDKHGVDLVLGVVPSGLQIYNLDDKQTPRFSLSWSTMKDISLKDDKKFEIRLADKQVRNFIFQTTQRRTSKDILSTCTGYYLLHIRRQQPETMEVSEIRASQRQQKQKKWEAEKSAEAAAALEEFVKQHEKVDEVRSEMKKCLMEAERINKEMEQDEEDLVRAEMEAAEAHRDRKSVQREILALREKLVHSLRPVEEQEKLQLWKYFPLQESEKVRELRVGNTLHRIDARKPVQELCLTVATV